LHAATAQVGVAIANFLPQVTITGTSAVRDRHGRSIQGRHGFLERSPNLTRPSSRAELDSPRGCRRCLDQAEAQYRSVVLTAFKM
jgi:outer membrane protein TolC